MKTRILGAAACAALALAAADLALAGPYQGYQQVPYQPQPRPELYIFGYGGVNFLNELEGESRGGGFYSIEVGTDEGFGVGGGIGLRFPQFFGGSRLEVEGYFRDNDSEGVLPSDFPFGGSGEISMNGVMVNFLKEFAWNGVVPYVGIGVGAGTTSLEVIYNGGAIDADEATFNWQAIAGMEFPFWQRVSLYAEYRFMSVDDFTMDAVTPGGTRVMDFDDFNTHTIIGGFRIYF